MKSDLLLRELHELDEAIDGVEAAMESPAPGQAIGLSDEAARAALAHLRSVLCARLHRVEGRYFDHLRGMRRFR